MNRRSANLLFSFTSNANILFVIVNYYYVQRFLATDFEMMKFDRQ